jgi:hypothetical protein
VPDVLHGIMDTAQDDPHFAPRLAQEYVLLEALLAVFVGGCAMEAVDAVCTTGAICP